MRAVGVLLFAIVFPTTLVAASTYASDGLPQPLELLSPEQPTRARVQHYQALRLYTQARLLEQERRHAEAARLLERAHVLEPSSAAVCKALAKVCFILDRELRGLEFCRLALELDPTDFDLLCQYGTALRELGRKKDALPILSRSVAHDEAKRQPGVRAELLFALASVQEDLQLHEAAAESYAAVLGLLDQPELILADPASVSREELAAEAARTCELLAHARLRAGQYTEAIAAFKEVQERDPRSANRLGLHLAMVCEAAGNRPQALAHLEDYLATQPADIEPYEKLIELLVGLGRSDEATRKLEAALRREPFNQKLRLLLGRHHLAQQDAARAEDLFWAAWSQMPTEDSYRAWAGVLAAQGRWDELLRKFDESCQSSESAPVAKLQVDVIASDRRLVVGLGTAAVRQLELGTPPSPTTRTLLTGLSRQAQHFENAEALCRSLVRDEPDPGPAYLELCRILSAARRYSAEAQVCAEALTKKSSVDGLVFQLERAKALSLCGMTKQAEHLLRELLALEPAGTPRSWQIRFMLGTVLFRAGKLEEAASEAEAVLAIEAEAGTQRHVRHLLATIFVRAEEFEHAQTHLEVLLENDPDDPVVLNDLGFLWALQGKNLDSAERLIRRAIALERAERRRNWSPLAPPGAAVDAAAFLDSLAWTLHKRGRHAEAARLLEQAVQLPDGEEPIHYDHLGDIYQTLNEPMKARAAWQRAADLYELPQNESLSTARRTVVSKIRGVGTAIVPAGGAAGK